MSEPMLTIHNRHSAAGGIPPTFSTEAANLYVGSFGACRGDLGSTRLPAASSACS
jgi:hypothetical protein